MENPAQGGVSEECRFGKFDGSDDTRKSHDPQAAARALEAGLISISDSDHLDGALLAEIDARDSATIMRWRLTERQCLHSAVTFLWTLPPDTREELCEAALHDLRAGPPPVTFWSLKNEARDWAFFASRAERCHYLAAAWGQISPDDRRRFLRRAL